MRFLSFSFFVFAFLFHLTIAQATEDETTEIETDETSDTESSSLRIGVHLGGGSYVIRPPQDENGEITLLSGSGFSGFGIRIAANATLDIHSLLRAQVEIAINRSQVAGFAEQDEVRRELALCLNTLEVPIGLESHLKLGSLELRGAFGLAPRFVFHASVDEDTQTNFSTEEPSPDLRTKPQLGSYIGLGSVISVNNMQIPFGLRATYNLTYPNSTKDRIDGSSTENPGSYLADTDWTIVFSVGFEFFR